MLWPEAIEMAIDRVNALDFLSLEEKRGIFHDNAAGFSASRAFRPRIPYRYPEAAPPTSDRPRMIRLHPRMMMRHPAATALVTGDAPDEAALAVLSQDPRTGRIAAGIAFDDEEPQGKLEVEFTEIEVEVEEGVVIDGVEIIGPIEVELEDDESIVVQRAVNADLRDGGHIEILLDMNARTWLLAMDPDLRRVAHQVFAEAISVVVR